MLSVAFSLIRICVSEQNLTRNFLPPSSNYLLLQTNYSKVQWLKMTILCYSRFCGSEILEGLDWAALAWLPSCCCNQMPPGPRVIWRLYWARHPRWLKHRAGSWFWLSANSSAAMYVRTPTCELSSMAASAWWFFFMWRFRAPACMFQQPRRSLQGLLKPSLRNQVASLQLYSVDRSSHKPSWMKWRSLDPTPQWSIKDIF